jgi:hypothetical protein
VLLAVLAIGATAPAAGATFNQPTHSSPIALSADDQFVWSVNPRPCGRI